MGNKYFRKALRYATENLPAGFLRDKRIGVDFMYLFHRCLSALHVSWVVWRDSALILKWFRDRVKALSDACRWVVLVADGNNLPGKADTNSERASRVKNIQAQVTALQKMITENSMVAHGSKEGKAIDKASSTIASSIPHDLFDIVRNAIVETGFPNVEFRCAPYEADHQLLFLSSQGDIDLIICTDSDFMLNGCPCVLFEHDFNFKTKQHSGKLLQIKNVMARAKKLCKLSQTQAEAEVGIVFSGMTDTRKRSEEVQHSLLFFDLLNRFGPAVFLDIAIITGNDYSHVNGLGLVKAAKIIKACRGPSESNAALTTNTVVAMSSQAAAECDAIDAKDYKDKFLKAFHCFRHATVADWVSKTHRSLDGQLPPDYALAWIGTPLRTVSEVYHQSIGLAKFDRFKLDSYPVVVIPDTVKMGLLTLMMSKDQVKLQLAARLMRVPRTIKDVRRLLLVQMYNESRLSHGSKPRIVYPELLRDGVTYEPVVVDDFESKELNGKSSDGKGKGKSKKKGIQVLRQESEAACGPLASQIGDW